MSEEALIAEDTLLLLFQPDSGTIAGENILFYVLGGAVLADLALTGRVEAEEHGLFTRVRAVGDGDAPDPLLAPALTSLSKKAQDVQAVLAGIGPQLRGPVLDRVVARGDLNRAEGKVLGLFPTTKLTLAGERRSDLIRRVRAALIDGDDPDPAPRRASPSCRRAARSPSSTRRSPGAAMSTRGRSGSRTATGVPQRHRARWCAR